MRTIQNPLALALASALLAMAAGCGGDDNDDDSSSPPPPPPPTEPTPVTLRGLVMVDQAVRNVVVCMDLNANSACDGGEPASARTDASGAYSLTYDANKISPAQVAAAALVAPLVPGAVNGPDTAVDAANPGAAATTRPFVLRQVPGKSGQINPLTTLVATGMTASMDEGAARTNTALQLGIAQDKIDNYQDDPAFDPSRVADNARTMAKFTAAALEAGAVLAVGDQMAAAEATAGELSRLSYVDAANYEFRTFSNLAKGAGSAGRPYAEQRTLVNAGQAVTDVRVVYPQAYLTPAGWKRCDNTSVHSNTAGNPSRGRYCEAEDSVSYTVVSDLSGQSMATVINNLQANPGSNVINNGVPTGALLSAVGAATFPTGSQLRERTRLILAQPIFFLSITSDARPQTEATTLEQLIAAKPAAGVNLADGVGSLSLGLSTTAQRNLRVAFTGITSPTEGTVQFYDCELDATGMMASNCSVTQTGTYRIETVNGVRLMRFAGYAPTPASGQENFYAEVHGTSTGNYVFRARQAKPTLALGVVNAQRPNSTAWTALKAALGL